MFQLKTEDRLRSWREFRSSIDHLSIPEALQKTAELWSTAPFTPYKLDVADPNSWPDPWTLIEGNIYCDIAKAAGILYTMLLTRHRDQLEFELRVYQDPETGFMYNLAWFNQGKYILNLIDREVVNNEQFNKNMILLQQYTALELQLEKY